MSTWKTTENVLLYTSYDSLKVFIANPESKKTWGPVQKISNSIKPPISISNTGSTIKFKDGIVYLKVSEDNYIKIGNLEFENFLECISGATITDGETSGVIFGFSDLKPDRTIILFPGTELLIKAEKESLRKINFDLHKKTTKFIPGNKYETENGSLWYIGEYVYKRRNSAEKMNMFSNILPESKKVSDLFLNLSICMSIGKLKSYTFDSCGRPLLLLTGNKESMFDTGIKELELDRGITKDLIEERIDKFIVENKEYVTFGSSIYFYNKIHPLIEFLKISAKSKDSLNDSSYEKIINILEVNLKKICFERYFDEENGYINNHYLYSNKLTSDLIKKLLQFIDNDEYCLWFLTDLGIDLKKIAEKVIKESTPIPKKLEFYNFQDFIDNIGRIKYKDPETFKKDVDFVFVNGSSRKFSAFFSSGDYLNMMVEIYKEALETNGANLKYFNIINIGSTKRPKIIYEFTVSFEDIMKHYGVKDIYDLPENIKKEMTDAKHYEVSFKVKEDSKPLTI